MDIPISDSEFQIPCIVEQSPFLSCTYIGYPTNFGCSLPNSCTLDLLYLLPFQTQASRQLSNLGTGYVAPLSWKLNASGLGTGCPGPWTLNHGSWILDPKPWTLDPEPWTLDPEPWTLDPGPWTMNHEPWADHKSWTLNPKP
jgi:hypothetical protein